MTGAIGDVHSSQNSVQIDTLGLETYGIHTNADVIKDFTVLFTATVFYIPGGSGSIPPFLKGVVGLGLLMDGFNEATAGIVKMKRVFSKTVRDQEMKSDEAIIGEGVSGLTCLSCGLYKMFGGLYALALKV